MEKKKSENRTLSNEETEEIVNTLIQNIMVLKEDEGITWDDFKKEINVGQSAISNWGSETKDGKGKRLIVPKFESVLKIAHYFNVSLDWLAGLSTNREVYPVPLTYKEWIITIENYLDNGVVRPFYRPELDKRPPIYDDETQEKMESFIKSFVSGSFGSDVPETIEVPIEDYFNVEYTYTLQPDSIYDVTEDMDGTYPDILEIKDTFLRCIIACLYYYKENGLEEYYKSFREHIINTYGKKEVLNLDVYELRIHTYPDSKRTTHEKKLFKKYNEVSETIFAEYKSINEINEAELAKIWKKLKYWKEKLVEGKIKTVH